MKAWKKVLTIGITLVLLFIVAACGNAKSDGDTAKTNTLEEIKKRDKLVAGVKYDTNLFGLKDPKDNEVKGFDIDIAKEIAKHILGDPEKIELKEVTSKTRMPLLNNGDIDMIIATMTITEERAKEVDFSEVYFDAGQSLLVHVDSPITGVEDLDGKTVIAVKGSTSAQNIREHAPDATVDEYENYAEAFTALKSGKGDALTTDNSILLGMQEQDANYHLVGELFTDEPYGVAVRKGDKEFLDEINKVLADLEESGRYDEIYEKWFGESPE